MNERIYQFGPFELSDRERVLRRDGTVVPVPPKSMAALLALVKAMGRAVTKADLLAEIWPDTFVEEGTLAQTVSILRRQLTVNRKAENPIETISRVGYRLRIPVTVASTQRQAEAAAEMEPPEAAAPELEVSESTGIAVPEQLADPLPTPNSIWLSQRTLAVGLCISLAVGAASVLLARRSGLTQNPKPEKLAATPAASATVLYPVISVPDGDRISAASVSPDGLLIAYSGREGVLVHAFAGGDQLLPSRPGFRVSRISWFQDNEQILMSGTDGKTQEHQAWRVPRRGGFMKEVATNANLASVSPDGSSIAYTRDGDSEIWIADADGQKEHRLTADAQGSYPYLVWAPGGDRLLVNHVNAAGAAYESINARSGSVLDREDGTSFASGYVLADGRVYFPASDANDPFGRTRLMMVHTDRKSGRFLDKPREMLSTRGSCSAISASTDGRRFALLLDRAATGTFVATLREPGPSLDGVKELTPKEEDSYPHAWTPDGSSVVLDYVFQGKWAVFTQPVDGPAHLVAKLPYSAAMAQVTPDGHWMMFLQFPAATVSANAIYRVPIQGGRPEQVPTTGEIEDFRCSVSAAGVCVLRQVVSNKEVVYYALDPVKGVGRELARSEWQPVLLGDWGLSPDGSTIAAADHDTLKPGIRLVPLKNSPGNIHVLPLHGHGTLLSASWAADGRSLFVECRTAESFELVSLDFNGHTKLLRKSPVPIWAIPSRDGTKLAFPGLTRNSNVWTADVAP